MGHFTCNIQYPYNKNLNFEISAKQLWYLHFPSSTTMSYFYLWLKEQIFLQKINIYPNNFNIKDTIQIVSFNICTKEEDYFYYQQRYQSAENEYVPLLKDYIGQDISPFKNLISQNPLHPLLLKPITFLSTGEFKIACILKSLNSHAKILFLEEPFLGLDIENQLLINQFFHFLINT